MKVKYKKIKKQTGVSIIYYKKVTSTNQVSKSIEEFPTVVLAKKQTKGKGTQGRRFISPKGKGIYMSINYSKIPNEYLKYITPIISVIVSNCIDKHIQHKTKIKWINDIFLRDKKICGILTEYTDHLIIGIGVNVYKHTFIIKNASSIQNITKRKIDINALINDIIDEVIKTLNYLSIDSIKDLIKEYKEKSMIIGKRIYISNEHKEYLVKDIDESCHLVLENNGTKVLSNATQYEIIEPYFEN